MPDRRPIAVRNSKLAAHVAKALAERDISPNFVSKSSMVFAAFAGTTFWLSGTTHGFWYVLCLVGAAIGCQFRLLCNLFDGMIAVKGRRGTPDGPFWNEAPDRVADTLILVGLGLGTGYPSLGWAAAASAVGTAYTRELAVARGLDADFRGPMAKPQRMTVATVAAILAIFVPTILGLSLLLLSLWIIVLGSVVTILRRSRGMIASLNSVPKIDE